LEETTTHTIGQNVLDMSAMEDETATLHWLADEVPLGPSRAGLGSLVAEEEFRKED